MKNGGFLLVELLVYLGIFSLIMASSVSTFFYLSKDNQNLGQSALISDEAEFILKKIDWLIINSKIIQPASGNSSFELVVKSETGEKITIGTFDNGVFLQIGSEEKKILNNKQVKIENLNFENLQVSENTPLSIIKVRFLIDGREFNLARLKYEN